MKIATLLPLLLTGCPGAEKGEVCVGECDSSSQETAETAETDAQETAETAETSETAETGEPWDPNAPLELCINEFMPDNDTSFADEFGTYSDWIELHNPGDEPISLDGWTVTDDADDPELFELHGGLTLGPGEFIVFYADDEPDLGPLHLGFKLSQDGGTLGVFAPDGRGSLVTYGYVETDISAARVTDCCSEESGCWEFVYSGSPGATNSPPEPETVELVPAGSEWRYWDLGSEPTGDWTVADFDDSTWLSGVGPLGYGDTHIVTEISYGADASAKYTTTYFRLVFDASDVALYTAVTGGALVDDAAILYLNGTEIERSSNMPAGEASFDTLASSSTSDETGYGAFVVDETLLVEGQNVLAVEVHQSSLDSSDLGFDLRLEAEVLATE